MIAAADSMVPRATEPAPMRTAGGPFNRREVFGRRRKRRRSAFDLGVGAPHERPANHKGRGKPMAAQRGIGHATLRKPNL
jgi:hypothetical protein